MDLEPHKDLNSLISGAYLKSEYIKNEVRNAGDISKIVAFIDHDICSLPDRITLWGVREATVSGNKDIVFFPIAIGCGALTYIKESGGYKYYHLSVCISNSPIDERNARVKRVIKENNIHSISDFTSLPGSKYTSLAETIVLNDNKPSPKCGYFVNLICALDENAGSVIVIHPKAYKDNLVPLLGNEVAPHEVPWYVLPIKDGYTERYKDVVLKYVSQGSPLSKDNYVFKKMDTGILNTTFNIIAMATSLKIIADDAVANYFENEKR